MDIALRRPGLTALLRHMRQLVRQEPLASLRAGRIAPFIEEDVAASGDRVGAVLARNLRVAMDAYRLAFDAEIPRALAPGKREALAGTCVSCQPARLGYPD